VQPTWSTVKISFLNILTGPGPRTGSKGHQLHPLHHPKVIEIAQLGSRRAALCIVVTSFYHILVPLPVSRVQASWRHRGGTFLRTDAAARFSL
jgi:hypothetical protein